ncbi:hypothetical protein SADUNF_SadunfUnG0001100 [Salix dunnii]|uniref:Uncharacterized protein n=1 Tax=Salix dunnii TaxID=1413687 RepID=A0A835MH23_9ROSI|nr:hypothetical protein SADUNF_SadunfUnG0001100 [Salix dunnii]
MKQRFLELPYYISHDDNRNHRDSSCIPWLCCWNYDSRRRATALSDDHWRSGPKQNGMIKEEKKEPGSKQATYGTCYTCQRPIDTSQRYWHQHDSSDCTKTKHQCSRCSSTPPSRFDPPPIIQQFHKLDQERPVRGNIETTQGALNNAVLVYGLKVLLIITGNSQEQSFTFWECSGADVAMGEPKIKAVTSILNYHDHSTDSSLVISQVHCSKAKPFENWLSSHVFSPELEVHHPAFPVVFPLCLKICTWD